jgi:hypothetical protein
MNNDATGSNFKVVRTGAVQSLEHYKQLFENAKKEGLHRVVVFSTVAKFWEIEAQGFVQLDKTHVMARQVTYRILYMGTDESLVGWLRGLASVMQDMADKAGMEKGPEISVGLGGLIQ